MDDRNLGGERVENWRVHVNKREIVNERGFYVAFVTDELTAAQIVRDHNEHQLLSAERDGLREVNKQLVEALREIVVGSGVEFNDARLDYVVMQVNRAAIADANDALEVAAALNEQGNESG